MTNAMDTARGGQFIGNSEGDCGGGGTCALPPEAIQTERGIPTKMKPAATTVWLPSISIGH